MVRFVSSDGSITTVTALVAIAGSASNVGKTTLACRLLEKLPRWEAIKVTKGHYRSCGKDPHACCVSHLLGDKPLVTSGRAATYTRGKDTGRYWDAGAANVHWVVATRKDVADGLREALARVSPAAPGVVVEGTGFLRSIAAECSILVVPAEPVELKASAVAVLPTVDYVYVSGARRGDDRAAAALAKHLRARGANCLLPPLLYDEDFSALVDIVRGAARKT
jgi:molybdopterin-guanine dinucleotide biosynthesis protein